MAYYHVLLSFDNLPIEAKCMLSDLSEKNLREKFLKPYRRGENFLCGNEVVEVLRIKKILIIETEEESENELKKIQEKSLKEIEEFNRTSGLIIISPGRGYKAEDIVEVGKDVTSNYVFGPPGQGNTWNRISNHTLIKWIFNICTGLILAALVWWFGWN